MTIVDDAVFHDGEPLTAEDVAFSIQLYNDTQDFPYLPSYASYFETIEATDATTVTLHDRGADRHLRSRTWPSCTSSQAHLGGGQATRSSSRTPR